MDISFSNNKLKKYANTDSEAIKKLGPVRAKIYKQRLDDLRAASTLEDVRYLPGKYHELVGNRKGQWACSLDGSYRLIFESNHEPIPSNDSGQYVWVEITSVAIVEIKDYH